MYVVKVWVGKWMFFCMLGEVNEIWFVVVCVMVNNELGIVVKVVLKLEEEDLRKD